MSVKTATQENFETEILSANRAIVDFWAEWCGPCKMFAPVFHEMAEEMPDTVFAKVNVDEQNDLAARYKVMMIPTVIVFENGKAVKRQSGALTKQALKDLIEG